LVEAEAAEAAQVYVVEVLMAQVVRVLLLMCLRHKVAAAGLVEHLEAQVLLIHVLALKLRVAADHTAVAAEALAWVHKVTVKMAQSVLCGPVTLVHSQLLA
jgi:hypothetical protein